MGVINALGFLGKVLRKRRLKRRGLSMGVKRKTGDKPSLVSHFESSAFARAETGLAFIVLAVLIVCSGGYYYWPRLTVGESAMEDVYASIDFTFRDDARTELLRQEAAQKIPVIYKLDESRVTADLDSLIALLKKPAEGKEESPSSPDSVRGISELLPSLGKEEVSALISTPKAAELLSTLKQIILRACRYRVAATAVPYPPEQPELEVRTLEEVSSQLQGGVKKEFPSPLNEEVERLLKAISFHFADIPLGESPSDFISPPRYLREDTDSLKKLRAFARKSVPPQHTTVREGTKIVARGEEITPSHVAQVQQMRKALTEKRSPRARLFGLAGAAMIVTAIVVICATFLARFHRPVYASNSHLVLVAAVVLISMTISKVFTYTRPASAFLGYPIAVPFGSFIISMMLGLRLAVFVTIPAALLVGVSFGSSLSPVLVGVVGGWAAAFFARRVRHRRDFIRTGAAVGVVNGLTIAAIGALTSARVGTLVVQAGGGVAVAVGSILVAAISLPAFEWVFKTPTNVSLVELTDSNHPLLKRMIMEAPGTYYHSLMVGNLAESASDAVGANPLLARVGSYFHDIGKLKKPLYFSENEAFGRSKHDTLSPSMSHLIILSHVKDGVDLACKHKLNKALVDIIRQHHGTSLDYYFYRRAGEITGSDPPVDENEFRYPGPKPQTRESAIIMLADSVEAASRSLEKPTTAKIRGVVRNIIKTRFEDGQLDECDLTLKDLHKIEETFDRILVNTLHQRVKYPEERKEDKGETGERPIQELTGGSGHPAG